MYLTRNIFNCKIAESSSIKNIEIGIKLIIYQPVGCHILIIIHKTTS